MPQTATKTQLSPAHLLELQSSGIAQDIIDLNFRSLNSPSEVSRLLNRRDLGGIGFSGWSVSGINPETEAASEAIQYKPDSPRTLPRRNGSSRVLKYESPVGSPATPLFLRVNPGYWAGVLASRQPVFITEGAKKAAFLLSLGYPAVSLPGVANGQNTGVLHPWLSMFAGIGREVRICFDGDWRKNKDVAIALDTLGRLLASAGGTVRVVDIPEGPAKGIDDYGYAHGEAKTRCLLDSALTFAQWRKASEALRRSKANLTVAEAFGEVDDLESEDLSAVNVMRRLQEISQRSGIQPKDLAGYYNAAEEERRRQDAIATGRAEFEKIRRFQDAKIEVEEIFPNAIGRAMTSASRADRITANRYILPLFSGISACVGSRLKLIDIEGETLEDSRYSVAIYYGIDVGPASSGKTTAIDRMTDPLNAIQADDDKKLVEARKTMRKFVARLQRAKSDERAEIEDQIEKLNEEIDELSRCRVFNSGTPEGFSRTLAKQKPNSGTVLVCDEATRLMSLGKYQGKSSDAEQWLLEAWNGALKTRTHFANADNNYLLDGQVMSIISGTQPDLIGKIFTAEGDSSGKSSRWLMIRSEPEENAWQRPSGPRVSIFRLLKDCYQWMESLPDTVIRMDDAAQDFYWDRYETYQKNVRLQADVNPAYSFYLGKANQHLLRIALGIHAIDCYCDKSKDVSVVTLDTMERASMLTTFFINQFRLIQSENMPIDINLAGLQLKVYQYLKTAKEPVTAYKIKHSWWRKKEITTRDIEIALDQLAELGYAIKEDRAYSFAEEPDAKAPSPPDSPEPMPETSELPEGWTEEDVTAVEDGLRQLSIQRRKEARSSIPVELWTRFSLTDLDLMREIKADMLVSPAIGTPEYEPELKGIVQSARAGICQVCWSHANGEISESEISADSLVIIESA